MSLLSLKAVVLNASDLRPVLHGQLLCFVSDTIDSIERYHEALYTVKESYATVTACCLSKRGEGSRYKQFTVTKQLVLLSVDKRLPLQRHVVPLQLTITRPLLYTTIAS